MKDTTAVRTVRPRIQRRATEGGNASSISHSSLTGFRWKPRGISANRSCPCGVFISSVIEVPRELFHPKGKTNQACPPHGSAPKMGQKGSPPSVIGPPNASRCPSRLAFAISHWAAQLTSSHGLFESSFGVRQSIVPSIMIEAAPARAIALANGSKSVSESAYWIEEWEKAMPATGSEVSGRKTCAVRGPKDPWNETTFAATPSRSPIVEAGPALQVGTDCAMQGTLTSATTRREENRYRTVHLT
jgi:hypothetical protein